MIQRQLSDLLDPIELGKKDKYQFKTEPYPPYPLGTKEANEWLHAYRMARYDEDWQENNREAIEVFKKVVER